MLRYEGPAKVTLRQGDWVLLMQTMDKVEGLVSNVRLRVERLRPNCVLCSLDRGDGAKTLHVIYRRPFSIKVGQTGIVVVRQQLPLVPAYALTLNKAQGQTLGRVLFDARRCPFSHGHTYVLFSRVRNRQSIAAVVDDRSCEEDADGGRTLVTGTVTYPELLH